MINQAINHYVYGVTHDIFSEPVTSYANLAIEALEKQVPRNVIHSGYFYGYTHMCPCCKGHVEKRAYDDKDMYCRTCGQALDWGEIDDKL